MRRLQYLLAGLSTMLMLSIAVACSDVTGVTRPPIPPPNFAENQDACVQWSCAMGDCAQDPAIYGPCCVEMGAPGEGVPPPSSCVPPYNPGCEEGDPGAGVETFNCRTHTWSCDAFTCCYTQDMDHCQQGTATQNCPTPRYCTTPP